MLPLRAGAGVVPPAAGLLCAGLLFDVAALGLDAAALARVGRGGARLGWTRRLSREVVDLGRRGAWGLAMKHNSRSARGAGCATANKRYSLKTNKDV
jgi:hypothetical protein